MIHFLRSAWQGREKAWVVFWGWLVGASFLLGAVFFGLAWVVNVTAFSFALDVLSIAYSVFILACTWRCAFNVRRKFWGWLLRGYTVLTLFYLVVFNGFLLYTGTLPISLAVETMQSVSLQSEVEAERAKDPFHGKCEHEATVWSMTTPESEQKPGESYADYLDRDTAAEEKVYTDCLARHRGWMEQCTQKFNQMYVDQGLDPEKYANIREDYVRDCYKELDKK